MKFIVEIPDECVTMDTCFTEWVQNAGKDFRFNILPKGHGRLIDADEVRAKFVEYRNKWDVKCLKLQADNDYELGRWESYDFAVDDIDAAPTIIEADGGAE